MSKGYIKLHRKIWDHPFWREKRKFSRAEAWIDLILMANGMDREVIFDGRPMLIKRGQLLTSQRKLAARWEWSKTKTADFLKISSKPDHLIKIISDRKKSFITILNYDKYNPLPGNEKTTENEEKKTTERPQKDHRLVPNNKVKERDKHKSSIKGAIDKEGKREKKKEDRDKDLENFLRQVVDVCKKN